METHDRARQGGDRRDLEALRPRALDAHRWDLFDLVFTEDVVAEFGPAGAAWRGLAEFKRSFAEFHRTLDSHQHTMMGQVVKVEGDQAYAFSYGNWLLVRNAEKAAPPGWAPVGTTTPSSGPVPAGVSGTGCVA